MQNLFLVVLTSLFCISCTKNDNSYFPLQNGLKWHYSVSLTTRDGLEKQKYILHNKGSSSINGKLVYIRKSLDGTNLHYSITNEGIYYLGSSSNMLINPKFSSNQSLIIPNPIALNKKWEQVTTTKLLKKTGPPQRTEFKIIAEVPLEIEIVSLDETVSVPAGKYDKCIKIVMTGSSYKDAGNYVGLTLVSVEQTNWYAPGIGLIKTERIEKTKSDALDKGTLSIELTRFDSK
ncbi:MAG: hypothetical protein ACJ0Q4_03370 [Gammaproteobacteria bacterium]